MKKKIKQVFAHCGRDGYVIDAPLNKFIETLPQNGTEITKITYITNNFKEAEIRSAIVESEEN